MKKAMLLVISFCGTLMLSACGGGPQQSPVPLSITTASLPNGTAWVAYSQTIEASSGVGPYTWSVATGALPHNLSLSNGAASLVTVSGTPDTAVQALPFTIQVTDAAGHVAKRAYTVSILLEPDTLVASAPSFSFGLQLNGTASAPQTLTLTNNGTAPLVIVGIATGTPEFAAASTCGFSIAASASCTISLTYTPVGLGPSATALTITDNSAGSPHSYALDGVGVTQGPNVTFWSGTSYQFSSTPGVPSVPQTAQLANFGNAPLDITSVVASAEFSETDDCVGAIPPGASCTIGVTFTPNTTGTIQGTISVTDNAPGSPQQVSLTGRSTIGQCRSRGQVCSAAAKCCAGLRCSYAGGLLFPIYVCE